MKRFKPSFLLESVYQIRGEDLKKIGLTSVLVDVDNTLLAWNQEEATEEMKTWIKGLQEAGLRVLLVSNNTQKRVAPLAFACQVDFLANAQKPLPYRLNRLIRDKNLDKASCLLVGDQMFTDMISGSLAQVRTCLVQPLVNHDRLYTRLLRKTERRWLKALHKEGLEWRKRLGK